MDITLVPIDVWVTLVTMIVTLILGEISKKHANIKSKMIPLQNLLIGLIVCLIEYAITKDFNAAVAISGIASGGIYDIAKAFSQLFEKDEKGE